VVAERDRLREELDATERALVDACDALCQLRNAVLARQRAAAELSELYREGAIARARAVERDTNSALN
jgi:hypothetical protein